MGQMDHRDIFRTRLTGYVALFWFTRGISFFHSEFSDFLESDQKAHSSAYRHSWTACGRLQSPNVPNGIETLITG